MGCDSEEPTAYTGPHGLPSSSARAITTSMSGTNFVYVALRDIGSSLELGFLSNERLGYVRGAAASADFRSWWRIAVRGNAGRPPRAVILGTHAPPFERRSPSIEGF
jgi:hypothetical protein